MPPTLTTQASQLQQLAAATQGPAIIQASQLQQLAAATQGPAIIQASQLQQLAAVLVRSEKIEASQLQQLAAIPQRFKGLEVSQLQQLAVVAGRSTNKQTRSWSFTLDGHDFYCLRLGESSTLIYDLTTQKWMQWDGAGLPFWRAQVGTNWLGLGKAAYAAGAASQVVAGDDVFGMLWTLDPEQGFDQAVEPSNPVQTVTRTVVANSTIRGRQRRRVNAVYLTISGGAPVEQTSLVSLRTSDDQGKTWYQHETINVNAFDATNTLKWRSLGIATSPGRIFEFSDTGAMIRIDGADIDVEEPQ